MLSPAAPRPVPSPSPTNRAAWLASTTLPSLSLAALSFPSSTVSLPSLHLPWAADWPAAAAQDDPGRWVPPGRSTTVPALPGRSPGLHHVAFCCDTTARFCVMVFMAVDGAVAGADLSHRLVVAPTSARHLAPPPLPRGRGCLLGGWLAAQHPCHPWGGLFDTIVGAASTHGPVVGGYRVVVAKIKI